jgi:hypothetical protein
MYNADIVDYKFWILVAIGVGQLIFSYLAVYPLRQKTTSADSVPSPIVKRYWPIGLIFVLMLCSWIPYFLTPASVPQYFITWSATPDGGYVADIDTTFLADRRSTRRIMLVGVVMSANVDPMNDPHILKTRTYDIELPAMRLQGVSRPDFSNIEIPGANVQLYLLDVPKDIPIERLVTLADAEKLKAKILTHAGYRIYGPSFAS